MIGCPGRTPLPWKIGMIGCPGRTPLPWKIGMIGCPGRSPLPWKIGMIGCPGRTLLPDPSVTNNQRHITSQKSEDLKETSVYKESHMKHAAQCMGECRVYF
jgi:hypothetical protein